jgi:hypothetical protein
MTCGSRGWSSEMAKPGCAPPGRWIENVSVPRPLTATRTASAASSGGVGPAPISEPGHCRRLSMNSARCCPVAGPLEPGSSGS